MLCSASDRSRSVTHRAGLLVAVCALHAGLLSWSALRNSPTEEESGHLAAGLSHCLYGRFDLNRIDPPLVRMVAALPILGSDIKTDWRNLVSANPVARPEKNVGRDLAAANGERFTWYVTEARWACIPFSVLGALICFVWAADLFGRPAGWLAMCIWCFCPNVLGHGALLTPGVGASATGVTASYLFWRWLRHPRVRIALFAGTTLGLAGLSSGTGLLLFVIWPLVWLVAACGRSRDFAACRGGHGFGQILLMTGVALWVINAGYGFVGSFRSIGQFRFASYTLSGLSPSSDEADLLAPRTGNRLAGSWGGFMPSMIPADYLLGLDRTRWYLEHGHWSYLRGRWQRGGWWPYYLYAMAVKLPLGMWFLALLAAVACGIDSRYRARWADESAILLPAAFVLLVFSAQQAVGRHLYWVLPAFPYFMISVSRVMRGVQLSHTSMAVLATMASAWMLGSSLWVYPHSLSYFNEFAGGPRGGPGHLLGSDADCGQDLLYLKRWAESHSEARPLHVACAGGFEPALLGLPPIEMGPLVVSAPDGSGRRPARAHQMCGWWAISVGMLYARTGEYAGFLRLQPQAMAGYSVAIYRIESDQPPLAPGVPRSIE